MIRDGARKAEERDRYAVVRVKRRSGIGARGGGYGGHAERRTLLRERAQPLKTMPQIF